MFITFYKLYIIQLNEISIYENKIKWHLHVFHISTLNLYLLIFMYLNISHEILLLFKYVIENNNKAKKSEDRTRY